MQDVINNSPIGQYIYHFSGKSWPVQVGSCSVYAKNKFAYNQNRYYICGEDKDFRELRDFRDLRDFMELRDFRDLRDLRDFRELRDLWELRDFRDLRGFRDW